MRVYDGELLSVTSVVSLRDPFDSRSFEFWCAKEGYDPELVLDTSKILGTKVSDLIEAKTKGLEALLEPPFDKVEKALYTAVSSFTDDWKVVDCEKVVKNEKLHYAGRFDGIIERNGERFLADWKTWGASRDKPYKRDSKKIKHVRWQLNLYAEAMGWKDGLCVVVFKSDGTWEREVVKRDKDMVKWVEDNQELILKTIEDEKHKESDKKD